jgi:glycosyltransferase involved in cell wall biosynthesis
MPNLSKSRVLLVLEATLGGTGRHILDLANGLVSRGYEVHLVYSLMRSDPQFDSGLDRLCRARPELRTHEIAITRSVTLSDARVFWRLFRYVKKFGPFHIVHGHSTKAGFIARLVPGLGRAARLYTPHALMTMDSNLRGLSRFAVATLESLLARRSRKVIVVSEQEHLCALDTGIPESKLVRIENGVDTRELATRALARENIRRELGIPPKAACVGYVGRFCDQKEPARIIEAFALVRKSASRPTKLVMLGFGPLENALKSRSVELGIDRDVIWPGPLDGTKYVAAFDVLAHSSRTEAFAYVLLEALASGVPVVATRVGAADELIGDGSAGYICDPWATEKFAELVLKVLEEPATRSSLSAAARTVAARFDVKCMVDKVSALYDAVTSGSQPSSKSEMHVAART